MEFCPLTALCLCIYLAFFPKDSTKFYTVFIYCNSALATSIGVGHNKLVYHEMLDLISLAVHLWPTICLWNLRWYTLPYE